ncbi:MAG: hypothetical protein AAFX76_14395 [Planctomycetota bacterium]
MISTTDLAQAFEQIGARTRLSPMGMDLRVQPVDQPGIAVSVATDHRGPYFLIRLNYACVVDLRVLRIKPEDFELVLSADDWGNAVDAPPRVFRCVAAPGGWSVESESGASA